MIKNILILAGMLVLIGYGGICLAGDTEVDKAKAVDLGKITVTAAGVGRESLEVPSSVSIISEKEIKDSNAKNISGLLKDLAGIYMYDSSGVGTAGRVNMRGFWGGMSTHQLVLLDGIPQNKNENKLVDWDLISLDNIERIEVVRGPNSALYGDNAMSGVINIITKGPSTTPETKISGSYGDYDTENYKISTSGLFKRVGYYFNAGRKSTDGFRRHSDYENIHLNGKLDFLIDEMQNLRLSLDYYEKERGANIWAITEAQLEQDRRQARPGTENDKGEAKKSNLGITYHRGIGNICQTDGTFYYRHEDEEYFHTSGSTGSSTVEQLKDEDACGLLANLNINPEIFGIRHSFTSGVDLEKNDFDYEEFASPYQVRGRIRKDYYIKRYKIGPYIQNEIKIFEPLKLIAGARYDRIKFDFTDQRNENNSKDKKMSKISPKCGIVYNYKEDSNLYANYAKAFRTPTIGQMFTYTNSNIDLEPEEAKSYEAGIHHKFNDNVKINSAFYWMELDNEIGYNYAEKKYENYVETSHKGVETGLDFRIIEGLSGFVNYTYSRAKNESGEDEDKYLAHIPINKGSLGVRYETDFGLNANIIITRVGSSYLDSANDAKLRAYTTVDTKLSFEHKLGSVFLGVDNLLDEIYNCYGYVSGGVKKFNPAPERTFTFGMEVKF